eukprot:1765265-Lingulodinium_polyedra.AAC.1
MQGCTQALRLHLGTMPTGVACGGPSLRARVPAVAGGRAGTRRYPKHRARLQLDFSLNEPIHSFPS